MAYRGVLPVRLYAEVTVNPASINAATVLPISVTVPGAKVGRLFLAQVDSLETDLILMNPGLCSTAGTVVFRIYNPTASPIDPASQTFKVYGF